MIDTTPCSARITGLWVECGDCGASIDFDESQIDEDESGAFSIRPEDRFAKCGGCGALIDCTAIEFMQIPKGE